MVLAELEFSCFLELYNFEGIVLQADVLLHDVQLAVERQKFVIGIGDLCNKIRDHKILAF